MNSKVKRATWSLLAGCELAVMVGLPVWEEIRWLARYSTLKRIMLFSALSKL
jgi:hypothetical protein